MTDEILQREEIFKKYRELKIQANNTITKSRETRTTYRNLREEVDTIHEELRRTERLIAIMIENDCSPVEAKLKFGELIDGSPNKSDDCDSESDEHYDVDHTPSTDLIKMRMQIFLS